MKILHIIFSFQIGGIETMLVNILNEQVKIAENVSLIIINDDYDPSLVRKINPKVNVSFFNREKGTKKIWDIIRFNKWVIKDNPDIIHIHDINIKKILFWKRKRTFLTVHDVNIFLKKWNNANTLISISNTVQKHLINNCGIESTLIYNGIKFANIKAKSNWDKKEDVFKIIQISRLDDIKKGQSILIKALDILNKQDIGRKIHIDFIGEGFSFDYLKELVTKLGLNNQIRFLGVKDSEYIYSNLHTYDLLIQPSIYEGFGLTVVEGMAAKIPVLVSANDGPMEIIKDGKYGFFFENKNEEDCAKKIIEIINHPYLAEIIHTAYKYAYKNFNIERTAKEYISLYDKLT